MTVDISLSIGGTRLPSPLILGSFDALVDARVLLRCFEVCGGALGAVVTKSTTLQPRPGYPEPRVARQGAGLLVASGNPNPGIGKMAEAVRALKQEVDDAVVFGSIVNDPDQPLGSLDEEFGELAAGYAAAGADGVELNLSCPHLDRDEKERTVVPAQDPATVARLVEAAKSAVARAGRSDCLVIPKLTGWNCDPSATALAAQQAGADAVTLSNLFPGTGYYTGAADKSGASRYRVGDYLVANRKGGCSGRGMHGPVLLMIETLSERLDIPVIGSGGCAADLDALVQTLMAGAAAVETVTPFWFRDTADMGPLSGIDTLAGKLRDYLAAFGLGRADELRQLRKEAGRA